MTSPQFCRIFCLNGPRYGSEVPKLANVKESITPGEREFGARRN
jgi:hypothetical protein